MTWKVLIITWPTFLITFALAQAPDTLWTRTYGGIDLDRGYMVQQTSDSGYIIVGRTASFGSGWMDVYVIKTDINGDILWTKTFGWALGDWGMAIQQTGDGGYIIAGSTYSHSGAEHDDVYLIKTNSSGESVWMKTFGGQYIQRGYFVEQTLDAGYIIAGWTEPIGGADVYLIKTDHSGNAQWIKTYGGTGGDRGYSVTQTSDSGYILAGETSSFGAGSWDVYLIKTDDNGDTLWTKTCGGSEWDCGESVQETSDCGYVIVGYTYSFGAGLSDIYIIKTNMFGDTLWTRAYGGVGWDIGKSIQETADGGYVIAGYTTSFGAGSWDVYLIKTDDNGDTLWTKTCGGSGMDYGYSIQQTIDDGYIVVGWTDSFGLGFDDVWLLKLEPDIGVGEEKTINIKNNLLGATLLTGPLQLPTDRKCNVYDITGRTVMPDKMKPGIYFLEIDGKISQKIVKIR